MKDVFPEDLLKSISSGMGADSGTEKVLILNKIAPYYNQMRYSQDDKFNCDENQPAVQDQLELPHNNRCRAGTVNTN